MISPDEVVHIEKPLNLLQRIHAIMIDVPYIQKGKEIELKGGRGYKVVTHDDVTRKIRAAMVKHRVACWIISCKSSEVEMVFTNSYGDRKETRTKAEITVRYASIDDPKDTIDAESFGYGLDSGDKGSGKATSVSFKYNLLKTFMLETGEDSDLDASKDRAMEEQTDATNKADIAREVKKNELWTLMQASDLGDEVGVGLVETHMKTTIVNMSIEGMQEVIDHINSGGVFS